MSSHIERWTSPEQGATAVEYSLMVGLITLVIVSAVAAFGQAVLTQLFEKASTSF